VHRDEPALDEAALGGALAEGSLPRRVDQGKAALGPSISHGSSTR
jgi:hypothetical protein